MTDDLLAFQTDIFAAINQADDVKTLEALRVAILGKSGALTQQLKELGQTSADHRRDRGAALNVLKTETTKRIDARRLALEEKELETRLASEWQDVTLPPMLEPAGCIHPISRTMDEITAIFGTMGFSVVEGPDIETDFNNFTALNIPAHHPARADHDTFYLPSLTDGQAPRVLRTHTSPVQIRMMMNSAPPFRIIAPGRTYRADHDATHSPMFHQCEGLVIDRSITLGHLKGCLIDFLQSYFGVTDLPVRFRASYFPFTEPSMEVDIGWNKRTGTIGRTDGQQPDWLEVLGSGMVHPRVLANCGVDPSQWQGFAFGMGIERLTMLKHGIADLRRFYESDLRWLRHYGFSAFQAMAFHEGLS